MASGYNRVQLIGNIGRDADLKFTATGAAVVSLSLATTETWTKDGQKQEATEWHRVVLWGKMAENLATYLVKGKQIFVEGRLQTREWTDKFLIKRKSTEIRADRVLLLGSKGGTTPATATPDEPNGNVDGDNSDNSDIPF